MTEAELPHKKIEELILKDTAPKTRSEQEIAGYRDALNLIHESGQHLRCCNKPR